MSAVNLDGQPSPHRRAPRRLGGPTHPFADSWPSPTRLVGIPPSFRSSGADLLRLFGAISGIEPRKRIGR